MEFTNSSYILSYCIIAQTWGLLGNGVGKSDNEFHRSPWYVKKNPEVFLKNKDIARRAVCIKEPLIELSNYDPKRELKIKPLILDNLFGAIQHFRSIASSCPASLKTFPLFPRTDLSASPGSVASSPSHLAPHERSIADRFSLTTI